MSYIIVFSTFNNKQMLRIKIPVYRKWLLYQLVHN